MNMRPEMPRFSKEIEKAPLPLLEHLNLVDQVDGAFDAYMKAIRTYKKETKGLSGDDPRWHELASHVNTLESDYKTLREQSNESYRALSAADQETFLDANAATKKGRAALRESFSETPSSLEQASTSETESNPEHQSESVEMIDEQAEPTPGLAQEIVAPKVIRAPQSEVRPDLAELESLHHAESFAPQPTFFERMRASRLKTLGASLISLLTSGGVVKAVEHAAQELHSIGEAKSQVEKIALQSNLDFMDISAREGIVQALPDQDELITINHIELTRAKATDEVNKWYTNLLSEARMPMSALLEDCETQLPNGDTVLDAVKCDLLYGNQIDLNAQARQSLNVLTDLSSPEYTFVSDVLRDSVYHRPSGFTVSEGFSVLSLSPHDTQSIPQSFQKNTEFLYDTYYGDAYALTRATLSSIDLESYTAPEQENLKEALQHAIEKEIELSNQMIIVSSLLSNVENQYSEASLKEGFKNADTGEFSSAQIDRAMLNVTQADDAWNSIAQLVHTPDASSLADQLKFAHHTKFEAIMTMSQEIDTDDTGLYEQAKQWSADQANPGK